ncbi:DUF6544 family protein [Jannaschia ovalis]|uniref:Uncharacterized protein n=1 Tax=Jannaschia ovalis TaxID=3038773 RepID=A0ABY8LBB1_9RHOB|nr:DUF6544 family protein [Jannaschia sp. GRR-S6-38]WGH78561.1 hypothetical protein P8627_16330 [Jannaschia sp. GRR-S6-38]
MTARRLALGLAALLALGAGAALALRAADARAEGALRAALLKAGRDAPAPAFHPAMLDGLPAPARRFFRFAIAPGTPLRIAATIEMGGTLSLGPRDDARDQPMTARQILAPPHGFLWQVETGGAMRLTGSDALGAGTSSTRFRLLSALPVVRVAGDPNHFRSAFGRMVGEGLFWTPAAFLPQAQSGWDALAWEAVDGDTARVVVAKYGLEQAAEITVDPEGRLLRVVFRRWSNENAARRYRLQPFGGDVSGFARFDGFGLPTRVTGGNHYGTELYHPFFKAKATRITLR